MDAAVKPASAVGGVENGEADGDGGDVDAAVKPASVDDGVENGEASGDDEVVGNAEGVAGVGPDVSMKEQRSVFPRVVL